MLQVHSVHAYQLALRSGRSIDWLTSRVACLSLLVGTLAAIVLARASLAVDLIAVAGGIMATALAVFVMHGSPHRHLARTGVKLRLVFGCPVVV